jgi:uncharacterized membrane protein
MRTADISVIGWIHTIACTLALILGAWNILATKGTTPHKWRGFGYVLSMVIANVLALAIYRFDINLAAGRAVRASSAFSIGLRSRRSFSRLLASTPHHVRAVGSGPMLIPSA